MRNRQTNTRVPNSFQRHFGTPVRRIATHAIISAGLLAIPCLAQPSGVVYSTTVPYSGMANNEGFSLYPNYAGPNVSLVATDSSGNSYIAGAVASSGLPTTPGVYQSRYEGGTCGYGEFSGPCPSVFVAKFDSKGTLLFLTYLGGASSNVPTGLAVDASGNIFLGVQSGGVSYAAKLSKNGTGVGWVAFFKTGVLTPLALAPDGSVYCLTQAFDASTLTKLSANGQVVATVSLSSDTQAVAVGSDGSLYLGGQSVTKMDPNLSGAVWQKSADGVVSLMQPAPDGSLWVTGTTSDTHFSVLPGAFDSHFSGGQTSSAFLVHLSADGTKTLAATYLPASLTSLVLDDSGNVIFSANNQNGFHATPGAQWPCAQTGRGEPPIPIARYGLGFFGKIDPAAQHLLWGTWAGPSVPIGPAAVNAEGNAIAAGIVPGQTDITLTALATVPGPIRLVESCIAQLGSPNNSGPLAPGEIFSIYNAGFGPVQGVAAQLTSNTTGNAIGTELGGVQVLIEDTPVPLLYVSSGQINLVAPYLLNGRTAAHIKIVTSDATSNEVVLGVRASAPEIFNDSNGTAAVLNQDGTVNGPKNPAHIGDTLAMFVSGVGQTNPPGVDGEIPETSGGKPVLPIRVQLNLSTFANVTYAGNAPGLVSGVAQVNFQLPQFNQTGVGPPYQALVVLYAGGENSNPGDSRADTNIWIE
jgi:uncharacterized protein (TIGR03437 family)